MKPVPAEALTAETAGTLSGAVISLAGGAEMTTGWTLEGGKPRRWERGPGKQHQASGSQAVDREDSGRPAAELGRPVPPAGWGNGARFRPLRADGGDSSGGCRPWGQRRDDDGRHLHGNKWDHPSTLCEGRSRLDPYVSFKPSSQLTAVCDPYRKGICLRAAARAGDSSTPSLLRLAVP